MKKTKAKPITQPPIVKGLALLMFTVLMVGFVAYRAGYFDSTPATIDNNQLDDNSVTPPSDTFILSDSFLKESVVLPGSKSMIISKGNPSDSKSKNITNTKIYSTKSGKIINPSNNNIKPKMSSSKSGTIIKSDDIGFDSNDLKVIAPSSKSGAVFSPDDIYSSSSKSMTILKPEDFNKSSKDSLDKLKQQKKQPNKPKK